MAQVVAAAEQNCNVCLSAYSKMSDEDEINISMHSIDYTSNIFH